MLVCLKFLVTPYVLPVLHMAMFGSIYTTMAIAIERYSATLIIPNKVSKYYVVNGLYTALFIKEMIHFEASPQKRFIFVQQISSMKILSNLVHNNLSQNIVQWQFDQIF